MRAVDTNVLVRALTWDDPVQSPAAETFVRLNAPVWVSHVVLIESFWVLESAYGCGKPTLVEAMKRILDSADFAVEEPATAKAALAVYQGRGKVTFEDCMILAIARKAGCLPIATFDKALAKVEGAQLLTPLVPPGVGGKPQR